MTDSVRFSMRIPLDLKEKLQAQAQTRGIPLNQLILQALHSYLASGFSTGTESEVLNKLEFRVSQLETQMQNILKSHPLSSVLSAPHSPTPDLPNSLKPEGWDPVQCSFEDWLFQIWSKLAKQDTDRAESDPTIVWGHPVTVERIHDTGFWSMHLRRFIDRLIESAAETEGLCLFADEASRLELVDCRPGSLTFLQPTEVDPNPNRNSNGKSPLY
jgi:hypothetical protein